MSFGTRLGEHIDELRRRTKVVFISLVAAVVLVLLLPLDPKQLLNLNSLYWTTPVTLFLDSIRTSVLPAGWTLIGFHVNEPLEVLLVASLVLGFTVDIPIIAYEVYAFIDPALKESERGAVYPVIITASGLFVVGILFGFFVLARFIFVAMQPFFQAVGAQPIIDVSDFYFIVFLSVLFSGVAFITPVFVFLLIRFGILSPRFFAKNRMIIWAVTYVATAFVTPDGGPLLDLMLFVPVIILLEAAVYMGRRYAPETTEVSPPRCRYCGEDLDPSKAFCVKCGRSSV